MLLDHCSKTFVSSTFQLSYSIFLFPIQWSSKGSLEQFSRIVYLLILGFDLLHSLCYFHILFYLVQYPTPYDQYCYHDYIFKNAHFSSLFLATEVVLNENVVILCCLFFHYDLHSSHPRNCSLQLIVSVINSH